MRKLAVLGLAALMAVGCSKNNGAQISAQIEGAGNAEVVLYQLAVNQVKTVDTIKTGADGKFSYTVAMPEAAPDFYYLTYKGKGKMAREEYNLPLTAESYVHLKEKIDGLLITKTRYLVPLHDGLTAEVDVFSHPNAGLHLAEVEFESIEEANAFVPPEWFGEDVTEDGRYHNSFMSGLK